jgi:hypothetical protein
MKRGQGQLRTIAINYLQDTYGWPRIGSTNGERCSKTVASVADPPYFDADPACYFDADPDPDPTFHLDPEPDLSFQIKAQNLEKVLK